jgi:hypothetical protein
MGFRAFLQALHKNAGKKQVDQATSHIPTQSFTMRHSQITQMTFTFWSAIPL